LKIFVGAASAAKGLEIMRKFQSSNLRKGRVSQPGNVYLLTTATFARRPVFNDLQAARCCILTLRHQQETGRVQSLAFVVMPDHLHWLVELHSGDLSGLMRSVKGAVARHFNRQRGGRDPVWQPGYHDHALRSNEDLREVARYVVANPVRAGLVESVWAYSYWDAVWVE
jgi:REP element-mobilizing transposase RayT